MKIQQNNNINFGAKRIANVRECVRHGVDGVVDVFVLGKDDKNFMTKFDAILDADKSEIITTRDNIRRTFESADVSFRNFFKTFLRRIENITTDKLRLADIMYLIAIKDRKTVAGIAEARGDVCPATRIERLIFKDYDPVVRNGLMYGLINMLRDNSSTALIGMGNLLPQRNYNLMYNNEFDSALVSLIEHTPDSKFEKVNDSCEYDLEEFLGIKDVEPETMD